MYFDPNLKCHYRVKKSNNQTDCNVMSKVGICMACAVVGISVAYIISRSFK